MKKTAEALLAEIRAVAHHACPVEQATKEGISDAEYADCDGCYAEDELGTLVGFIKNLAEELEIPLETPPYSMEYKGITLVGAESNSLCEPCFFYNDVDGEDCGAPECPGNGVWVRATPTADGEEA